VGRTPWVKHCVYMHSIFCVRVVVVFVLRLCMMAGLESLEYKWMYKFSSSGCNNYPVVASSKGGGDVTSSTAVHSGRSTSLGRATNIT